MYRILVVDDSPSTRSALTSAIEQLASAHVTASANAFEALKLLPREQFDLIITDINMPEINGLELLHYIRTNPAYKETPVIIVSTEGAERDRRKGLELGANEYVVKPFDPGGLLAIVQKYLGRG
ncbi:MAG: response regulator [Nitrospirae bacterium]|nr:response regulator [Nitrospirota bacterium]